MRKALTIENAYKIKHQVFELDGVWLDTMGRPEKNGAWLIWGSEKNGKTWLTLLLSDMLCRHEKLFYMSAEEGTGSAFIDSLKRANINSKNNMMHLMPYESLTDLYSRLKARRAPRIVVIDNLTVYAKELRGGALEKLLRDFPSVLFIFLAHEEKGEPYTAAAKLLRKLAKLIFYVEGLACTVGGRCPGGQLIIDPERAALYHGNHLLKATS